MKRGDKVFLIDNDTVIEVTVDKAYRKIDKNSNEYKVLDSEDLSSYKLCIHKVISLPKEHFNSILLGDTKNRSKLITQLISIGYKDCNFKKFLLKVYNFFSKKRDK